VGLVGVQTNQMPRALDLGRRLRDLGVQVCIGGFHVSATLALGRGMSGGLEEAREAGISVFAGEAEGRIDELLRDARAGRLRPVYELPQTLPEITEAPTPELSLGAIRRTAGGQASFDAGRGCPFSCSFCTVFNVQGHRSRARSPEVVAELVEQNLARGIRRFFITDDNFARNRRWEEILDRLIAIQQRDRFKLVIQVDTRCHTIPRFIDKAGRAGVRRVFIGLESIRAERLRAINKQQNRLADYREMLLAWRRHGVCTVGGYIIGLPGDTAESVVEDVRTIQQQLPIDFLQFLILTPLPGSAEHLRRLEDGVELEQDLNRYDLAHVTMPHDTMSTQEWLRVHRLAWDTYYTPEHIETLLRRARASGISLGKILGAAVWFHGAVTYEGLDPLEVGLVRRRHRRDRRPGYPIESLPAFWTRHLGHLSRSIAGSARTFLRYHRLRKAILADPTAREHSDSALVDERQGCHAS
jgi:radical SAM superfamily enzyme YgiQ (UPF0313 family)